MLCFSGSGWGRGVSQCPHPCAEWKEGSRQTGTGWARLKGLGEQRSDGHPLALAPCSRISAGEETELELGGQGEGSHSSLSRSAGRP